MSEEQTRATDDPEAPAPNPERLVTEPRGEPRTRATRRPGQSARRAGPRAPRGRPRARTEASEPNVEEGIRGLLQMPGTIAVMIGGRTGNVPLIADGATILVHGPEFAAALAELAGHDPRAMAILEKLLTFGPYGRTLTAAVIMGAQFARNHGANEEITSGFGAVPPEQIIAAAGIEAVAAPSPNGKDAPSPDGSAAV